MKNLIIIAVLILINIIHSHGQIVLQLQNFPADSDQVNYNIFIADSTLSEGSDGANAIWDFSNINLLPNDTSQIFWAAFSSAGCNGNGINMSSFTWAQCMWGSGLNYYTSNSNYDIQEEWCATGTSNTPPYRCYSTSWKQMKFPFTNNDTLISDFIYVMMPSGQTGGYGSDTTICDGFGNVIGLTGNSYNALRTKSIVFDTGLSAKMNPYTPVFANAYQIIYNWYTLSHKGPYARLKYTYQLDPATNQLTFKSKIFEIQNSTSTSDNINTIEQNITLSNNFTDETLKIKFNNSEFGNYNISVYSLDGKLKYTDIVNINSDGQSYDLEVDSFDSGMYIIRFEFKNQYMGSEKFVRK